MGGRHADLTLGENRGPVVVVKHRWAARPAGVAVVVGEMGLNLVRFHGSTLSCSGVTLHSVEGGLQVRDADLQRLDVERIHSGSKRFSHAFKQGSTVFHRQFVEVKLLDFGLVGFHSYILSFQG